MLHRALLPEYRQSRWSVQPCWAPGASMVVKPPTQNHRGQGRCVGPHPPTSSAFRSLAACGLLMESQRENQGVSYLPRPPCSLRRVGRLAGARLQSAPLWGVLLSLLTCVCTARSFPSAVRIPRPRAGDQGAKVDRLPLSDPGACPAISASQLLDCFPGAQSLSSLALTRLYSHVSSYQSYL